MIDTPRCWAIRIVEDGMGKNAAILKLDGKLCIREAEAEKHV
jgi:hypothetical protein